MMPVSKHIWHDLVVGSSAGKSAIDRCAVAVDAPRLYRSIVQQAQKLS